MKTKYIQILGIVTAAIYGALIVFLYAAAPRDIGEIPAKARSAIDATLNKGQVLTGTYEIDRARFDEGLAAFRAQNYPLARDRFERSDPEKRDANVQFYIAYSFYRQGWGRLTNDDALFKSGLAALERVPQIDPDFTATDADLKLRTVPELRNEFSEGLRLTADDFNPLRLVRERK